MGADIHVNTEIKVGGKWLHYGHPHIPRQYGLFAKMAGVRNETQWGIVPLEYHKGIPDDATEVTRLILKLEENSKRHEGWLDREQIHELVLWYEAKHEVSEYPYGLEGEFDYLPGGHGWRHDIERLGIEDIRFIFFFDHD